MKTYKYKNRRKKAKKWPWVVAIVAVVLIVGGGLLWINRDNIGLFGGNAESSETDDDETGAPIDKSDPEKPPSEQNWTPDDRDVTFDVWVTSKNIDGDTLRIRVQMNKYLSSGTCTIEIGNYTETVNVAPGPQAATCEGFDIKTSNFSGNEFTITVESGEEFGTIKGEL